MLVKFKKLVENAKAPERAYPTDAGWDLTAVWHEWNDKFKVKTYGTGIAVAIPEGYVGLLFPRSSVYKKDLMLSNSVGVIDAGFRGEILFKFKEAPLISPDVYTNGDRIGQLVVLPIGDVFWDETDKLPESIRDTKGHGSSDLLRKISS